MFHPEPMSRAVIWGTRANIKTAIQAIYESGATHLVTPSIAGGPFGRGHPDSDAPGIARMVTRIRALKKSLKITAERETKSDEKRERLSLEFATNIMAGLEKQVSHMDDSIEQMEARQRELTDQRKSLQLFALLGLPRNLFKPYRKIAWIYGQCATDPSHAMNQELDGKCEIFTAQRGKSILVAVFVETNDRDKAQTVLNMHRFTDIALPDSDRTLDIVDRELNAVREKLEALYDQRWELQFIFQTDLLDAEYVFSEALVCNDVRYRLTMSDRFFITDFWIPTRAIPDLKTLLDTHCPTGVDFQVLNSLETTGETADAEPAHAPVGDNGESDAALTTPPTLLSNPKPIKPFETLTDLLGTISYHEVDPTFTLAISIPLFFGFMVGDVGYGVLITLLTWFLYKKRPELRAISIIGMACGAMGAVMGIFLFGDMFGIPFHAEDGGASWSSWLHMPLPHPVFDKLGGDDMWELLLLSVLVGWLHLTIGYIIGFFNELKRSKRHAIGKIGWNILLFSFLLLALDFHPFEDTHLLRFLNHYLLGPIQSSEMKIAEIMVVIGAVIVIGTEGIVGAIELPGVFANIASYLRLTGICIAEGAAANAMDAIIAPFFSQGVSGVVFGVILTILIHVMLLALGIVSVGIQALRLNFYEFFTKFIEAEGIPYTPFRAKGAAPVQ